MKNNEKKLNEQQLNDTQLQDVTGGVLRLDKKTSTDGAVCNTANPTREYEKCDPMKTFDA